MPDLKFSIRADGQLCAQTKNYMGPVEVKSSFPWSEPTKALSIKDLSGNEIGFVDEISDLEHGCQNLLKKVLLDSSFVFEILDLLGVSEEYELRAWTVSTKQGERRFHTKLNDWPRELPGGSYLIVDIFGDHYLLKNQEKLSSKGKRLFSPFTG